MLDFFGVKVKQTGVYVHITGVSFNDLAKDIGNFYSTSLITKSMVRRESWNTIKVHNFFLVELREILKDLLQLRTIRSRRRELSELKLLLETETWLKDTINPSGPQFDFKRLDRFNTKPFPQQREFLELYPTIRDSYHLKGLLLDSVPGSGKAMPLDTPVKVPLGWKAIGDLKIDDVIVGPKGNHTKVTQVYPQGETDVYEFVLEDGRVVKSHPLHLWEVYEDNSETSCVTTTQDIVEHFYRYTYHLPLVDEIGGILETTTIDIKQTAECILNSTHPIDESVTELAYNERFAILKAMIEHSTTFVNKDGVTVFVEKEMGAINLQLLMWSIGGVANRTMDGTMFGVTIKHKNIGGLIRKILDDDITITFPLTIYKDLKVQIVKVSKVESAETVCISVDSEDKLFVVKDYVVTHNTFTSLMWSELLNDNKCLIVCPLPVVDEVWVKQINLHFKNPPRVWTAKSGRMLTEDYDYYVVHFDYLQGAGANILRDFIVNDLKKSKRQWKLIVDESHNVTEMKAKQTSNLVMISDTGAFSDALPGSGTAIKALGSEIYPILCLIDKHFDSIARKFFLESYGRNRPALLKMLSNRIGRGKFTIPELQGMGDPPPFEIVKVSIPNSSQYTLDAIKLQMQTYIAERVTFYNKNMPDFLAFYNETIHHYEATIGRDPKQLAELARYKEIVKRFRLRGYNGFTDSADSLFCKKVEEDIERGLKGKNLSDFRSIKSAVKYLGLKLRGEALGNVLGKARINAIKALVEHADLSKYINNVEKKTVIFTSYVDVLDETVKHLSDKGYKVVTVYGENSKDRERALDTMKNDPEANPLSTTFKSLQEGVPLLFANQILCMDAPFRDYQIKQVQARIWRTGQDSLCFFIMFDMDTGDKLNIMTRSLNILEWSKEQVDALLSRLEGHDIINSVSGIEMLDVSEEQDTPQIYHDDNVLSLFG